METKKSKEKYIVKDILHLTKLSPDELERILKKLDIKYLNVHPSNFLFNQIDLNSYNKILEYKDLRRCEKTTLKFAFERILSENNSGSKKILHINYILNKREIIKLTKLHFKYRNMFDLLLDETPLHASYLILGKVINYLNFVNESVRNQYLCIIPYFRIISEAILLAEYFITQKNTDKGKKALKNGIEMELHQVLKN